jgi:RNA polymerase sigma-70 factor (ECF subfamily)
MNLRDPETIRELYGRHGRGIFNYARKLVGDQHWAEEVLQETFLRAYSRAETFRQGARVSTWLYRIAMNLCYDHLRSPRNRPKVSLSDRYSGGDGAMSALSDRLESAESPPDDITADEEIAGLVRHAVSQLPDKERNVVILRHYQGLKFREIAEITGLTTRTVQNCLRRARDRIGSRLRKAGVGKVSKS